MRKIILTYLLLIGLSLSAQTLSENAFISLLTCTPGEELYARYGHTALRVCDEEQDLDVVFNYGIFDFNTDHFYWKFVKGETWYELGSSPYPENRKYLYNFVFDNCATRPFHMIDRIFCGNNAEGSWSEYIGAEGETYRRFIQHYTPKGSWADFGINLVFGPKADQAMYGEERLFLPEELMFYLSQARTADARMVSSEHIAPFEIQPVPWYKTWYLGIAIYFIVICLISLYDRKRQRWSWGVEVAVGIPYLMLLIIVTFLTFFSCHPLVGFGWRLLIIPLTHLCARLIYILR